MRGYGIVPGVATDQAQVAQRGGEAFAALPPAPGLAPYRWSTNSLDGRTWTPGERTLHVIGDHGGVKDPNPQLHVAAAMMQDASTHGVDLCYSVGDIDYFTGEAAEIGPQFYEPYAHYAVPIVGIPGNHDGAGQDQLATFMATFCDQTPRLLPEQAEYGRDTMDLPNCYWTMEDECLTIIGLYTNVPSGGGVDAVQRAWLTSELSAAPSDRPLIVALHHPPYSCDAHHGGSKRMGDMLDEAFASAGRAPELVLAGHVHNYQRFTRTHGGAQTAYIVCGASGYHHLHGMAHGAADGLQATADTVLDAFIDKRWGFLRLHASKTSLAGEYVTVDRAGAVAPADAFSLT